MDGSGSGQREMQSPPVSTMCRRPGCAFYAHSLFDGMCSKCYKDVNDQMSDSCNSPGSSAAPATSSASNSPVTANVSCQTSSVTATTSGASATSSSNTSSNTIDTGSVNTFDVSANMPAVKDLVTTTPANANEKSESTLPADADTSNSAKDKMKKKRCDVCKKRVGLTGFDCRCGGHYCSLHRYSDTHSCGFDYRELAQTEIRRQNPVVAAEKVKKI